MKLALNLRHESGFLHVQVQGKNTAENVAAYLAQVREACRERSCKAVLIEENLSGASLPLLQMFELASRGSENLRRLSLRIAYVDVNPEHDAERIRFAQTVASNRGVDVRVCATVEEARTWLLESLAT